MLLFKLLCCITFLISITRLPNLLYRTSPVSDFNFYLTPNKLLAIMVFFVNKLILHFCSVWIGNPEAISSKIIPKDQISWLQGYWSTSTCLFTLLSIFRNISGGVKINEVFLIIEWSSSLPKKYEESECFSLRSLNFLC